MDIHTIRQHLHTRSVYDIPLRVTFYARVSSESDEQLNSLGNQISYYRDLIQRNTAWTFIDGYIDEGLSGISTKKRENFHRMIEDARMGLFDLIITKEITRFARNTLDSIQFTRELLSYGVGVFFQNDNINTFDEDSELRLTIMSGIAQDELRKLSSRIKFGHQQAIKHNVVLGNSRIFGYIKQDKRLVIDETEAEMVRELFELYATGQYSMKQIENIFWEKGYRNHNGKRIYHTTMSSMISNPKYKGYYVGNKVRIVDMFTKKQKFLSPEEWVMFKDETGEIVPALVSEEIWEKANAVLARRSSDVKRRRNLCNHKNLLTGKIFCTHCGAPYYRTDSKDTKGNINSKWKCSGKIKKGAGSCPSIVLYESELKSVLFSVFKGAESDIETLIKRYIKMYSSLENDEHGLSSEIDSLQKKIKLAQKKKNKLLGFNVSGQISDRDFLSMNADCDFEIAEAEKKIHELEEKQQDRGEFQEHIKQLRDTLLSAADDAENYIITRDFVEKYIDRIFVTSESGKIRLEVHIFSGDTTTRYLERIEHRSGHMFKKMIESYEQQLANQG